MTCGGRSRPKSGYLAEARHRGTHPWQRGHCGRESGRLQGSALAGGEGSSRRIRLLPNPAWRTSYCRRRPRGLTAAGLSKHKDGSRGREAPRGRNGLASRAVHVRLATPDDLPLLQEQWLAFEHEVPPPAHVDHDEGRELAEIGEIVESGLAFVAEEGDRPVGFALARRTASHLGRLTDLYVVPEARRRGRRRGARARGGRGARPGRGSTISTSRWTPRTPVPVPCTSTGGSPRTE